VVLIDQDVETTVADSGSTRIESASMRGPLPVVLPPPMRGVRAISIPLDPRPMVIEPDPVTQTARDMAASPSPSFRWLQTLRVFAQRQLPLPRAFLKLHWEMSSTSTRVLLGVVALLLAFLVARSGQVPRSAAAEDEAGAATDAR
jgi:hypothetical protein